MLSCYFRALRLGGVLTSPQAAPSGLQMTPPSLPGTENPGKPGSPDFILILNLTIANEIVYLYTASSYYTYGWLEFIHKLTIIKINTYKISLKDEQTISASA